MENQGSVFARTSQYFSDSFAELKKVGSPTRQETVQATLVTIFIVMALSVIVALMDLVFKHIMDAVLQ